MQATTNALDLLRDHPEEVDALFAEIAAASDTDRKAELFQQLADALAAHSAIEEKIFYPTVLSDDTRGRLLEFTEEHLAVKRVIADLLALDPEDEHWDAKLVVLKEEVRHHAHDEEEGKLFPILEEQFDSEFLSGLGNELLAMFDELMESSPRMQVPAETTEAAPLESAAF